MYKQKYNNAKRSIPAHPTFVNDNHRDLHLWTVTSKIDRFTMINMSSKFDEEAHNGQYKVHSLFSYLSPVTMTFDIWPPKSKGSILSPKLTSLQSLMKKYTTVQYLSCSQAYLHICPLWPWPLTFKINRVHPLTMVNMSAKFDLEAQNCLVAIVLTSLFPYIIFSIVTLTFDLQNQ